MTKYFNIILLPIIICSCSRIDNSKSLLTSSIEIAYQNGHFEGCQVEINKKGVLTIGYEKRNPYNMVCYIDTLSNDMIDSVNYLLANLRKEKFKSAYQSHQQYCDVFNIQLNFGDLYIYTMIMGSNENDNNLVQFAKYITKIKLSPKKKVSSCYTFEGGGLWIPPPPDSSLN